MTAIGCLIYSIRSCGFSRQLFSCVCVCVFFFKQKTAYEMRISDWSSDVCSSDLALVMAGLVFVGERKIEKAGQQVAADAAIEVRGRDHPLVSRGGVKLAHGLDPFRWQVAGAVAIDDGSVSRGFTDVQHRPVAVPAPPVASGDRQPVGWGKQGSRR